MPATAAKLNASIIDYPRKELDTSIWNIEGEELELQPNIKDEIEDIIGSFLDDLNLPEEAIIDVFIYGSILTNQYNSKTDVDARVLLDPDIVFEHYPDITGKYLYDLTRDSIHGVPLGNTQHPFNASVVIEGEETELGQAQLGITERDPVYSMKEGKIIHEGIGYDESFDPDIEFMEERSDVVDIMTKLDTLVQDAKTDTIDIEVLKEAVGEVSNPEQLIEKIEDRLGTLNLTIEKMVQELADLRKERSESYGTAPEDDRHKAPGNIKYKLLEKYHYLDMLKKLKRLFKDGIGESEVDDVAETLNVKAFPYRQPGPPEHIEAPPTTIKWPGGPSTIDTGTIDEGGMLAQPQGATCPRCGHVNPLTASESDEITCESCGKKFTAKDGFSMGTGKSLPSQPTPYPYESDFQLYGQDLSPQVIEDMLRLLQSAGISPEELKMLEKKLKGEPAQPPNTTQPGTPGTQEVLKPGLQMNKMQMPAEKKGHLICGVILMENLIKKLDKIKADSTGGTGGVFGEPPGKNPGDDPYSSGGGALAEYGKDGDNVEDEDNKKKKKKGPEGDVIWEVLTVLEGIDILPFLEDEELLEELLAAFPLLGEPSTKIDTIVGLYTEPPEGIGQYRAPVDPEYDTIPRPRHRQRGPLQDGKGKGKGRPGGLRRNKNKEECPIGGPGKGKGEGLGKGKFRKDRIEETGEAVGINWWDKYKTAANELKETILEWLEENPNPEDEEVHALAEQIGIEKDELEEIIYEIATEHSEEGTNDEEASEEDELTEEIAMVLGEKIGIDWEDSTFDPEQFLMGIKVELEHGTKDPETNVTDDDLIETAKIAWAHLKELDDYYYRLKEMEEGADKSTKEESEDTNSESTDKEPIEGDGESEKSVGGFTEGFPGKTAAVFMTLCPNCRTIQAAPIEGNGVICPFCKKGWLPSLQQKDPERYKQYKEQTEQQSERMQETRLEQRGIPLEGARLDKSIARQINEELASAGLDGNTPFKQAHIGYNTTTEILAKYGLNPTMGIDDYFLISAKEGSRFLDLEYDNEEVENMNLTFSWYKHDETGNYECIAHLNY